MEIREGDRNKIENFPLYNEDNEGDEILVAVVDGQVAGYLQYSGCTLYFLEVAPEFQGQGIGSALLAALKADTDYLIALQAVPTAIGFYEKQGFIKSARPISEYSYGAGYADLEWFAEEE